MKQSANPKSEKAPSASVERNQPVPSGTAKTPEQALTDKLDALFASLKADNAQEALPPDQAHPKRR